MSDPTTLPVPTTVFTENLVTSIASRPVEEQRQIMKVVNDRFVPKGDAGLTVLWRWLLGGLFALAALCVLGTIILASNGKSTEATPMMILATAVVTGVIGLFSSSPVDPK